MNGRYLAVLNSADEKTRDRAMHGLIAICKSLAADGLEYSVKITPPGILVTASGTPKPRKPAKASQRRIPGLPQPLTVDRCKKELTALFANPNAYGYVDFEEYQADVEFWREMELLSGQRQKFNPFRNGDESGNDEIVAA